MRNIRYFFIGLNNKPNKRNPISKDTIFFWLLPSLFLGLIFIIVYQILPNNGIGVNKAKRGDYINLLFSLEVLKTLALTLKPIYLTWLFSPSQFP